MSLESLEGLETPGSLEGPESLESPGTLESPESVERPGSLESPGASPGRGGPCRLAARLNGVASTTPEVAVLIGL